MGSDWYSLFTILSNHTILTLVDGERQCATCGPVLSGDGQAHLTDAILAAGWKPPESMIQHANRDVAEAYRAAKALMSEGREPATKEIL